MRVRLHVLAVVTWTACGAAPAVVTPPVPPHAAPLPPLGEPAAIDPSVRGAAYLAAIAVPLQRGWRGFLDDCRTRLPATHPLNLMTRAATVDLVVARDGQVVSASEPASGDADFDRAVAGVVRDASPLPPPPVELLSDDDQLHVRWGFARDRRQAGPATAAIVQVDLPLRDAVNALIDRGELDRAARRLARAPTNDGDRRPVARAVMAAIVHDALHSSDTTSQRSALIAIHRAPFGLPYADLEPLLSTTQDADLRVLAVEVAVRYREASPRIHDALEVDLRAQSPTALAELRALIASGSTDAATAVVWRALDAAPANTVAIAAVGELPYDAARAPQIARWLTSRDPRVRAAACTAIAPHPPAGALVRGMRDPVAAVRAACARAATPPDAATLPALTALLRDGDDAVRAAAVTALGTRDPAHPPSVAADPAAAVRAALAALLDPDTPAAEVALRELAADRDADVRAAAYTSLVAHHRVVTAAVGDPSARVRLAIAPGITDAAALATLVRDPDPLVAGEALIAQYAQLGASAALAPALDRILAAPPASAERVRAALAWLLAP